MHFSIPISQLYCLPLTPSIWECCSICFWIVLPWKVYIETIILAIVWSIRLVWFKICNNLITIAFQPKTFRLSVVQRGRKFLVTRTSGFVSYRKWTNVFASRQWKGGQLILFIMNILNSLWHMTIYETNFCCSMFTIMTSSQDIKPWEKFRLIFPKWTSATVSRCGATYRNIRR